MFFLLPLNSQHSLSSRPLPYPHFLPSPTFLTLLTLQLHPSIPQPFLSSSYFIHLPPHILHISHIFHIIHIPPTPHSYLLSPHFSKPHMLLITIQRFSFPCFHLPGKMPIDGIFIHLAIFFYYCFQSIISLL